MAKRIWKSKCCLPCFVDSAPSNLKTTPGFLKRVASLAYESLLLIAILAVATFVFIALLGDATLPPKRYFLQAYLWLIAGGYFVWCWTRSGQTLAMKTWRIKVVNQSGQAISWQDACMRYLLATLFFGASFIWAIFDRDKQYLHDRLLGTNLILI